MLDSSFSNKFINNKVAFSFSSNIPSKLNITEVDTLSEQWPVQLADIAQFNDEQRKAFLEKINRISEYKHVANLVYLFQVILLRLQGRLNHLFVPLSQEDQLGIIVKLKEDIDACMEGTHNRAYEIVRSFIAPKDLLDLLQLVREDLVQKVASSIFNDVHEVNAVFTVAHQLGFGVRIRNIDDEFSHTTVIAKFNTISTALVHRFQNDFCFLCLPYLLRAQLHTLIAYCYSGEKESPGYVVGDCNRMAQILNQFLYTDPTEYKDYDFYFLTQKVPGYPSSRTSEQLLQTSSDEDEEDYLFFFSDLNWKKIEFLIFERLIERECILVPKLSADLIETLNDAAYYSRLISTADHNAWSALRTKVRNILLKTRQWTKEFFLRADPALVEFVVFEINAFTEEEFVLLARYLPFATFMRWINSSNRLNRFIITSSSNHSISEFLAQNFLCNTRVFDRSFIFDGLLALCTKIPDSQKDSFITTMTKLRESTMDEQDEDSLISTGGFAYKLAYFPVNCLHRPRLPQDLPVPQNGWSHLISALVTQERYFFAPDLLNKIERGLDKKKSLLTILQISSVDLWDYLNQAIFFFSEKNNVVQVQHLLRFFVEILPSLPSEHIPYFLGKINVPWGWFISLINKFDHAQFYLFYSFFSHLFLEIPQEHLPLLIGKIRTHRLNQGDIFIGALTQCQEENNFNRFKSILSFLSRIEQRTHTVNRSILMDRKILQTNEDSLLKQLMDLLLNSLEQGRVKYTNELIDFFLLFLEQAPIDAFGQFWMGKKDNVLQLRMQPDVNKSEFVNNEFVCEMIKKSRLTYPQETEKKITSFLSVLIKKIGDLSAHVLENKQAMYLSFSVMSYIRAIDQSSYFSRLFHNQHFVVPQKFKQHKATLESSYQDAIRQFSRTHPRNMTQEMKKELTTSRFHQHQWKQYHVSDADKDTFNRMHASIWGDEQKRSLCCF